MPKPTKNAKIPISGLKGSHGGVRKNSGRPPGSPNKATIRRELAASTAIDLVLSQLAPGQAEKLTPIEVMSLAMSALLTSGNLMGAVAVAEKLAPYVHAKVATMVPATVTALDLLPDPPPTPDEPGPPQPRL